MERWWAVGWKDFCRGVTAMNAGYSEEKGLGEIKGRVRETS